jgi:hypothetical protein
MTAGRPPSRRTWSSKMPSPAMPPDAEPTPRLTGRRQSLRDVNAARLLRK